MRVGSKLTLALAAGMTPLVVATSALAGVRQIGARDTTSANSFNLGIRSTLTQPPLPQATTDNATGYFWPGEYLSDGSFFQAGYATRYPGCSSTQAKWFVQGFDPSGNRTLVSSGACGLTGTHSFKIERGQAYPNGSRDWLAYLDGGALPGSRFNTFANSSGSNRGYAVSELSGSGTPSTSDAMGPVTYDPAIMTLRTSGGSYLASTSAVVHRQDSPCPPYRVKAIATNASKAGSGLTGDCLSSGAALW